MNDFYYFLLLIAAAATLLVVVRYVYVLLQFLNWRMRVPVSTPIPREAVPSMQRRVLDCALPELTALGFEYRISNSCPDLMANEAEPQYADLYWHAEEKTVAFVSLAEAPEVDFLYAVTFKTVFSDGYLVESVNRRRHLLVNDAEAERSMCCEIDDPYLENCNEQWDFHLRRLRTRGKGNEPRTAPVSECLDFDETWRRQQQSRLDLPDILQAAGIWRPATPVDRNDPSKSAGGRVYRLTLTAAWRMVRQLVAGMRRLNKIALPVQAAPEMYERRVDADLLAFARNESSSAWVRPRSQAWLPVVFIKTFIGVLVFAASYALIFDWDDLRDFLPVFFIALFLHELGPVLAMRGFGCKDLDLFVPPFFGDLAAGWRGQGGKARPWQLLLVYLAGPLPGLLLGICLLFLLLNGAFGHDWLCNESGCRVVTNGALGAPPLWLFPLIGVLLVLNGVSLWPLPVCHGGRILHTFLFSRHPYAYVLFCGMCFLSIAVLGSLYASIPGFSWLPFLGLFFLFALIPSMWRMAHLRRRALAGAGTPPTHIGLSASLFRLMTWERYRKLRFAMRLQAARMVVRAIPLESPGRGVTFAALSVYGAALLLPPLMLFTLPVLEPLKNEVVAAMEKNILSQDMGKNAGEDAGNRARQEKVSKIAWAKDDDERWLRITDAADWMMWETNDRQSAHAYYVWAEKLSRRFGADDPRRVESRINVARTAGDPEASRRVYEALLADLRQQPRGWETRIAEILMALYGLDAAAPPQIRIRYPAEAIVWSGDAPPEDSENIRFHIRSEYAWMLDLVGAPAAAGDLLERNLEDAWQTGPAMVATLHAVEFGWFLVGQGRAGEAQAILETALRHRTSEGGTLLVDDVAREALAWAFLAQGKNDAALRELRTLLGEWERMSPGTKGSSRKLGVLLDLVYAATQAGDGAAADTYRLRVRKMLESLPSQQREFLTNGSFSASGERYAASRRNDERQVILREIVASPGQ